MKRIYEMFLAFAGGCLLLAACEQDEKVVFSSTELGAPTKSFEVSYEPGEKHVDVYSNGEYTIKVVNGADDWVAYPAGSKFDEGFDVLYDANNSYPRSAMFILSLKNQQDTVYLRQEGRESARLSLEEPSVAPKGSEQSSFSINVDTNVEDENIDVALFFDDYSDTQWISAPVVENGKLVFNVSANPTDKSRKVQIELSFVDGWDNKVTASCYVNQMNKSDEAGRQLSFEQVRETLAKPDPGYKVTEDIIINGIVVSDRASLNTGENPRNTITFIDYDACERSFFFESLDGKYGFKVEMAKPEYNIFKRCDKVGLNLNGATVTKIVGPEEATGTRGMKAGDAPAVYYNITGLTVSAIVSHQSGTAADIPEKKMHIADLKDEDIYTYVTLLDCELPVRKGSMTPINEGYSIAGNANRSTKAALLMRDINGDDMYILTNTTCPYRRLGRKLPYGSGPMKGVIVHELFSTYNWQDNSSDNEDTWGYIGHYQIRHTCYEDFGMEDDFKNGFSALLTEYRYITADYQKELYPTYGTNGSMSHSYKYNASSSHGAGTTSIIGAEEFSYLGPIGTSTNYPFGYNPNNVTGLGIIMDNNNEWPDGYDWGNAAQGDAFANINKSEAGKGKTPTACKAAWSVWYNWNTSANRPYSYIFKFSTLDLNSRRSDANLHMSMQVGMLNVRRDNGSKGTYSYGPRFWEIQWSTTGIDENDRDWTTVQGEFMVPDTVNWTPATQFWQSPGFKTINVPLPNDLAGRPEVYIRIRPTRNLVGTDTAFAVAPPSNNTMEPSTAINYFAIRYNK